MQAVLDDKETTYSVWLIVLGIVLCASLFVLVMVFVLQPPASFASRLGCGIWCGFLLGAYIWMARLRWRWKRVNMRRQAAASGVHGGAALAAIQPFPDETALVLRAVIIHTVSRLRLMISLIEWGVICLIVFSLINAFVVGGDVGAVFLSNLQEHWPDMAVALAVALLLSLRRQYTQIEVNAEGLMFLAQGKTKLVRWDEARLFAVRGPRTSFSKAITYELASANEVITWKPLRRLHWWSIERPIVPFEEYQQQTEELLALIADRTHLPLYDVRQPPAE